MKLFSAIKGSGRRRVVLQKENGAAAVEFAIVLPLLAVLVFGTIEFGLLLYNQQVITNASREGARAAIVGDCSGVEDKRRKTDAEISQIVTDYCTDQNRKRLITFNAVNNLPITTVAPSPEACGLTVGDNVAVSVQYTYTFLVPSLLGFGPTKLLSAATVMKMESAP